MSLLGYAYLHAHLRLTGFEPVTHARLGAVTRVTVTANGLLVPAQVAGKTQTLLDHVLFALKHEGVNLQVLAQADMYVPDFIKQAIATKPIGAVFSSADFLPAGSRAAIDQTLTRMMKAGIIVRVAGGLLSRP